MELSLYDLYQKLLANMGPTNWWPANSKQQIMIEAILIQNTTEKNATQASLLMEKATHYKLDHIVTLPQKELEDLVRPAGFMTNKSKAIKTISQWYLDHEENPENIARIYGDDLRQSLLSLYGVGPETADVLLTYIFDCPQFISDKYARTLFTHLGIKGLNDYNSLSQQIGILEPPFSYQDAQEFHGLIDEFGKKYFRPIDNFNNSFLSEDSLYY